eukprot:6782204-Prymnesium_polylepis.1
MQSWPRERPATPPTPKAALKISSKRTQEGVDDKVFDLYDKSCNCGEEQEDWASVEPVATAMLGAATSAIKNQAGVQAGVEWKPCEAYDTYVPFDRLGDAAADVRPTEATSIVHQLGDEGIRQRATALHAFDAESDEQLTVQQGDAL